MVTETVTGDTIGVLTRLDVCKYGRKLGKRYEVDL